MNHDETLLKTLWPIQIFIIITLEYAKMQKKKYVLHDDNHTVHVVYRCTDLT